MVEEKAKDAGHGGGERLILHSRIRQKMKILLEEKAEK
jgi:hypothetical protein